VTIPDPALPPRISYHLPRWEAALRRHPDQSLVRYHLHGLRFGYRHGNDKRPDLRVDAILPNLASAFEHQDKISANIAAELAAGRYLGPFSSLADIPSEFRPFRNAPLGIVPKKHTDPPKFRSIQHFSFPEGASVNDGIDPDDFRIRYDGIHFLLALLVRLGPSAIFWKADVTDAFRTMPIHRSDWAMQGVFHLGRFYLDMYLPFGLRSAPFIFVSLMDLFNWICVEDHRLVNLGHYVDDFIYAASPELAAWSFAEFKSAADLYGVPFKASKYVEPTPTIEYVGFLVDAPSMSVSLPPDKRDRIRRLLAAWIGVPPAAPPVRSHHEAQSLLGHLMHVVQVLPDGKIFCDRLIALIHSWASPFAGRRHVSSALRADLSWWHDILDGWSGRRVLPILDWEEDLRFFTDASGSVGAGGFLGDRWWCLRWSSALIYGACRGYDIFWEEMFAVWVSSTFRPRPCRNRFLGRSSPSMASQ